MFKQLLVYIQMQWVPFSVITIGPVILILLISWSRKIQFFFNISNIETNQPLSFPKFIFILVMNLKKKQQNEIRMLLILIFML